MELTRTDAVFSRIAMVLFLCRNKSSRIDLKIYGELFWNILKILAKESTRGGPPAIHKDGGRAPALWVPWTSTDLNSNSIYSRSGRKKSGRRVHHVSRYEATVASCSSSGGQIWSLFWAPERGNRCRRHHQPSSITNFMMLTAVRE